MTKEIHPTQEAYAEGLKEGAWQEQEHMLMLMYNPTSPVIAIDERGALIVRVINKSPNFYCSTMHCVQQAEWNQKEIVWECECK